MKIGVDLVSIPRLAAAIERSGDGFLNRVFTPTELSQCGGSVERLAGRWAAKEAVIKALTESGVPVSRRKIEILSLSTGAPQVRLEADGHGLAIDVSITHDHDLAIAAVVVADGTPALLPAPEAVVLPSRPADGHKGTFGTVVAIAGSLGFTGAAYLTATAAARAGAGLVHLLVAESIYPILATKCTEVMATPIAEVAPGALGRVSQDPILRHLEKARAAVIGPGLGRDGSTWRLVNDLALHTQCPLVIDADGLNALADHNRHPRPLGRDRVLTPHPGEMARLMGMSTRDVQADRSGSALRAAAAWNAVVALKGANTVVATPDGRCSVDPHEVPALASGGTGDVLAGMIASLLAQGSDPYTAAVSAVYVHAAAGRRLAARLGDSGLLASDLLPEIPPVMDTLRRGGL